MLLNLAVELKQEAPRRTATQIATIIAEARGDAPSARTISRYFGRIGLARQLMDAMRTNNGDVKQTELPGQARSK